jgi:hypothetical protein
LPHKKGADSDTAAAIKKTKTGENIRYQASEPVRGQNVWKEKDFQYTAM